MEESLSSLEILTLLFLFLLSAFFSSSETAILSANKFKIEKLAREGNKNAQLILKLLESPQRLITTILTGNNLVNIAAASISAAIAIKLFGDLGVGIATAVVTVLTIIFGEVLPKNFALRFSDKLALLFAKPLYFFEILFWPVSWVLIKITEKLFPKNEENTLTEEELKIILEHSSKKGIIDKEEKEIIENVLELDDTIVKEIMTPRTKIVAIEENKAVKDALNLIKETGFSKIPVYSEKVDNIIGVIYLKDILKSDSNLSVKNLVKKVLFVPENKKVDDLFREMKKNKIKIAIVLDEFGGVAGLVTLEDILDYLVGVNEKRNGIIKIGNNSILVRGDTYLYEIERIFNKDLGESSNTVAGLIMEKIERIPKEGEKIRIDNLIFEVIEVKNNRIEKVRITKL